MDPDNYGNYDIDGMSYDPSSYQVIAGGDAQAPEPQAVHVDKLVHLHAPEEPRERSVGA